MAVSYRVVLSKRARADLASKVRTSKVKHHLLDVADVALDDHEWPDGWIEETPDGDVYYWRRGITVEERALLDASQARGEDHDDGRERAYDFGFTYVERGGPITGRMWKIISIWDKNDISRGLEELPEDQTWLF